VSAFNSSRFQSRNIFSTDQIATGLAIGPEGSDVLIRSDKDIVLEAKGNLTFDTQLNIKAGLVLSRRSITSSTTVLITDYFLGVSAAESLTITLPLASDLVPGQAFVLKDENGNLSDSLFITIITTSGETIDGEVSISLESPYSAINIYTDGLTKYFIY
jgi:hypothetical protein